MKKKSLVLGLLSTLSLVPCLAVETAEPSITVDCTKAVGPVKPVNGVGR